MTRSVVFILLLHCIVDAFSPCSPPRFDTFCEKLSGSWKYSNDVDGTDMHHIHAVEEVMRSEPSKEYERDCSILIAPMMVLSFFIVEYTHMDL
jgi:hypothetical protein